MKTFFESKTNWLGIITVLISALGLVSDYMQKTPVWTVPGIIGIVIGVLVVVLRTFFTDTAISTPAKVATFKQQQDALTAKSTYGMPQPK